MEDRPEFEEQSRNQDMDPKVKEIYEKLRYYAAHPARRKWLKRRDEAWKGAIENEQWDEDEKVELNAIGMDALVINKCKKGIQASCAMATYKKPEAVFLPIGMGDLYVAELFKRAYDYNWAVNSGNLTGNDVVEEAKVGGIGFFEANWDNNKGVLGKIVVDEADPTDLYWDPRSRKRDFSDTDIIKAKLRSHKYIKANYDVSDRDLDFQFSLDDAVETEGVTSGDNYKEFEDEHSVGRPDESRAKKKPSVWEIQALLLETVKEDWVATFDEEGNPASEPMDEMWEKTGEKDSQGREVLRHTETGEPGLLWKRTYEKRIYRLIVGKKLIEDEGNPFGLDSDRDPVVNIVPVREQRTRTSYPMSSTNYALPINKEKNKRRAQFILHVTHNVNSPIVQPEGTKWQDRYGKEAAPANPGTHGTVPKTAGFLPQRLAPGAVQAQLFGALEDRADRDIDQMYDTPPIAKGEVPQGMDPSGRAVLALQDMAGVMTTPFMTAYESGVVGIAKVMTYLSLKHWPRPMWRRLIEDSEWNDETVVEPDNEPGQEPQEKMNPLTGLPEEPEQPENGVTVAQKWQEALELIRPEDPTQEPGISLLNIDVKVLAGSSMPTNRIARQQVALEMKAQGVYDAEAVLVYTDDPQKDKILPRIREMEKAAALEAAEKQARKK